MAGVLPNKALPNKEEHIYWNASQYPGHFLDSESHRLSRRIPFVI